MNKIYLVSLGSYSDYEIDRAFSTREKAEQFINGSEYYNVEEYDVDVEEEAKVRHIIYITIRIQDGAIVNILQSVLIANELETTVDKIPGHLKVKVATGDKELAIKIATEKRQGYLKNKVLTSVNSYDWLEDKNETVNTCVSCGAEFKGHSARGGCKACVRGKETAYSSNCILMDN